MRARIVSALALLAAGRALAAAPPVEHRGSYLVIDGIRTYYEVHGSGPPLLLLHGGAVPLESFDEQVPAFEARYTVIEPERMGHGRTADADRPFSYHAMAEETVALVRRLGYSRVDVVGWSDGGIVGLDVAMNHPDLVGRLVVCGANFRTDGVRRAPPLDTPAARDAAARVDELRALGARLSPDGPAHFAVVLDKLRVLWRTEPEYAISDLARISAPTLVVIGDHDIVRPEHAAALAGAIPRAELRIVPGVTHLLPLEAPARFNALVLDFLGHPAPSAAGAEGSAGP